MRRFNSPKLSQAETDALVATRLQWILEVASPTCVFVFGSAARYEMRDDSDLDFIVITKNEDDVSSLAARVLGRKPPHDVAADILFYGERRFLERARLGGVCFLVLLGGFDNSIRQENLFDMAQQAQDVLSTTRAVLDWANESIREGREPS